MFSLTKTTYRNTNPPVTIYALLSKFWISGFTRFFAPDRPADFHLCPAPPRTALRIYILAPLEKAPPRTSLTDTQSNPQNAQISSNIFWWSNQTSHFAFLRPFLFWMGIWCPGGTGSKFCFLPVKKLKWTSTTDFSYKTLCYIFWHNCSKSQKVALDSHRALSRIELLRS